MKVVMVEPGRYARITELEDTLEAKQKAVGGLITCAYPWEEKVCIVANDEGFLNGMPFNRNIEGFQAIAGPFFICGITEDDFCSLTNEQAERYRQMFLQPEIFIEQEDNLFCIQYDNPALPDAPEEAARRFAQRGGFPDVCFAALSGTDDVLLLRYGISRYLPIWTPVDGKCGQECADALNGKMGVSKAQAAAMLYGSVIGWDKPGANPACYDENGRPKLPRNAAARPTRARSKVQEER